MRAASPPDCRRRDPVSGRAGFSLVEICLAVGIVAFALLPLVGLLSVGLDSYHKSNMRGRAAQAVSQIANCIKLAAVEIDPATGKPTGRYTAAYPLNNALVVRNPAESLPPPTPPMHWKFGDSGVQFIVYFADNGEITQRSANPSMVATVILTAPTAQFTPGTAQIVVAWPGLGDPTYSGTTGISFVNPQGHEESTISFIPISQ